MGVGVRVGVGVGVGVLGGAILFYRGIRQGEPRDEDERQDERRDENKLQDEDKRRDQDKRRDARKAALTSLFLGLAVVYVGSVAAGVCLAGRQNPYLPTVTLTVNHSKAIVKKAGLLSNSGSYWYVVDYCNEEKPNRLLAIPNASVDEADTAVGKPVALENGRARMSCPPESPPETTIESGPPRLVASAKASFDFTGHNDSTDVDDLTFECKIVGAEYQFCAYRKKYSKGYYSKDPNGEHTFSVKAKDLAGNMDQSPARRTWNVCNAAEPL